MAVGDSIQTYILLGVFSIPFLIKIIFNIQFWYIKRIRGANDYDNARGTHHKKIIEKKYAKLKVDVNKTRNQLLSARAHIRQFQVVELLLDMLSEVHLGQCGRRCLLLLLVNLLSVLL